MIGSTKNPIILPSGGRLLNDYSTPGIQSAAFPTLFPYGKGDCTKQDQVMHVTLTEAAKHLMWYAVRNDDGSFFIHLQNTNDGVTGSRTPSNVIVSIHKNVCI